MRCGSLGGFNRYEQSKIWANAANYNENEFYDILIYPSFFNRSDYLIGGSAYEGYVKRYQSVNEINEFLNKQLKDCMWLLRRDRLVW